ncbi:MAG TPA: hypothetical protein VMU00_09620 [Steroidobacteraceae bacterium]|nr:hypothetical protein [Steroidobacteraceae bacterium]
MPVRNADHQLSRPADRVTLLTGLEAFPGEHLGPAGTAAAGRQRRARST